MGTDGLEDGRAPSRLVTGGLLTSEVRRSTGQPVSGCCAHFPTESAPGFGRPWKKQGGSGIPTTFQGVG